MITRAWQRSFCSTLVALCALASGCLALRNNPTPTVENQPKELTKITMPEHRLEPPDIIQIDLIAAVPKPPYKLQPLDGISLRAAGVLPNEPIQGVYQVDTDGTINLGSSYGVYSVVGKTTAEVKAILLNGLKNVTRDPTLEVALAQSRGMQQVRGPHLVRPDGTVWFEMYGAVRVVGMTVPEARAAIEAHLSEFFLKPEVAVNITGYNSKVFYVVFDGLYNGAQTVIKLPITGNETVIDAVSQVGGLTLTADYKRIWIARPAPEGSNPQILPIDWRGITEKGEVATNYQLLPGDRLFVKSNEVAGFTARLDRALQPVERIIGFILLGQGAINQFQQNSFNRQNGTGFGF
ncbi:hypothetical protein BH11PLA2_BH11PLA2_42270 [soil metagenome]